MSPKKIYIYGIHPVEEALKQAQIIALFASKEGNQRDVSILLARAKKRGIKTEIVPQAQIGKMVGRVVHQGIVAEITAPKMVSFPVWSATFSKEDVNANTLVVLLDELTDPHNVGALIRTAVGMGAKAVLVPKHNQVGITSTVYKTSSGTASIVTLVEVTNVNQALRTLKEKGFWIYGLSEKGQNSLEKTIFDTATCLVIGSEGDGIRQKTSELCDVLVKIPMNPELDSYNASVAGAILMYEWRRQNG